MGSRTSPKQRQNLLMVDGFDSPVGTEQERRSAQVWPGRWVDSNPYGTFYHVTPDRPAYHTGADLNLPEDRDAHAPVYAAADGTVTFAQKGGGTWGNLIVVAHALSKQVVYTRYAHVEWIGVRVGQAVKRGQAIGRIGNAGGLFPYHLHFDISLTAMLARNPQDWPGIDEARLKRDYVNPLAFIRGNRPMTDEILLHTVIDQLKDAQDKLASLLMTAPPAPPEPTPALTTPTAVQVTSDNGLNVRAAPTVNAGILLKVGRGQGLTVIDDITADGYQWCRITEGLGVGGYVAKQFISVPQG